MALQLRLGDRGSEVQALQHALNLRVRPRPPLVEDSNFGARTQAAVRAFQASRGLSVDGVAGPRTLAALQLAPAGRPAPATPISSEFPGAPWMAVALREVGQNEIAGARHNDRIIDYHATTTLQATADETPWCASFVNWCLREVNIAGTNSALAASWLNWGQPCDPRAGAITVIFNTNASASLTSTGNHVAFLVQKTATHYILLGGNQSNQVKISRYPIASWQLRGHRWPNP